MSDKIRAALQEIAEYPALDAAELQRIARAALAQQPAAVAVPDDSGYPPCDYCGATMDRMPWHGSGTLNGSESRHIHACDACRRLLPTAEQPDTVKVPRELLDRIDETAIYDGSEACIDADLFMRLVSVLAGGDKP